MKICYVAGDIEIPYRKGTGCGGATHAYEVAKGLVEKGHRVYLLCCRGKGEIKDTKIDGIMVKRIFRRPGRIYLALKRTYLFWLFLRWPYHLIRQFSEFIALASFIASNRCDIIYERCGLSTKVHSLVYNLVGLPLVIEVNDYHDLISSKIAASMVTPNRLAISRDHRHKVKELPWGVNTDMFQPGLDAEWLRSSYPVAGKRIALLVCGGLPWHGLDETIEAALIATNEHKDLVFMVVGGGDHFQLYMDKVNSLGLRERFIFTGSVEYEKVPFFISIADISIAPYNSLLRTMSKRRDLFASPLKVFEYMACAKPVIITEVANKNRIIEHMRTGIVIKEDSPAEIAKAVSSLLVDEALGCALGKNAREAAEERFSWQRHVDELERLFSAHKR